MLKQIFPMLAFTLAAAGVISSPVVAQKATQRASRPVVEDWNQWRGPNRDGKIDSGVWPQSVQSDVLSEQWSVPLGPSYSGPIVTEKFVFVTETEGEQRELVKCFDRKTGDEIWQVSWPGAMKVPFFAAANGSWIRSTPVYADGILYVGGIRDVFVAIDVKQGKILWQKDFPELMGSQIPAFGCVCSPLVDGDHVYMQAGGAMHKLNRRTGESVWQSAQDGRGKNSSVFSSPAIGVIKGQRQLLVQGRNELMGIDLADGSVLWKQNIPAFRGMNIITPTLVDDAFFISNYRNPTVMLSVDKTTDGQFVFTEKWRNQSRGYMTTPVIIGGYAYTFLQDNRFACIDLSTGQEAWRSEKFGKYASLVANGDQILALTSNGDLVLFRGTPERFEQISRRNIAQDSWAHLAVRGDEVFVRSLNKLIALRWK